MNSYLCYGYRESEHKAIQHLKDPRKLPQERSYFSYGHMKNYIYTHINIILGNPHSLPATLPTFLKWVRFCNIL